MNSDSDLTLPPDVANQLVDYVTNENIILIGGQAVMFWAFYYGIAEGLKSLTRDIDFFGQRADVEDADLRLSNFTHETKFSDWDDTSPNSGLILVDVPGRKERVRIDFLWAVQGLGSSEIRERAVLANIPGVQKPVLVLHPVMCLESKIANLGSFPQKRTAEGIEQARLSTEIVKAFIGQLLKGNRERDALKIVERIAHVAESDAANFSFSVLDVDVLNSIPVEQFTSTEFKTIRVPQLQLHIADRRRRFSLLLPHEASPSNTSSMRYRT